jgi:hypothetical protein
MKLGAKLVHGEPWANYTNFQYTQWPRLEKKHHFPFYSTLYK